MSEQQATHVHSRRVRGALLSVRETAAALGVSESSIRRAISRGALPARTHNGVLRIARNDLDAYRTSDSDLIRPSPRLLRLVPQPPGAGVDTLPAPLTPFIGREREVAAARELLLQTGVRLLTLTGPGGVGKTRLALVVADDLRSTFRDGIAFVALAPIPEPELVTRAIAQVFAVHESTAQTLEEALHNYLHPRELLLILDNFEHLLPAAPLVADLLVACPRLKILITSRSVLHIYGEHDLVVSPFAVPDLTRLPELEELGDYDVVRLFMARARAARDDFTLSPENASAVAAVCQRLDGLPLAIELAAARSRLLSPQALLERLERRLPLLTGETAGQPTRFHSLRATIDWSHDLLNDADRACLRQLAVFVDGFTLAAAEWVIDEGDRVTSLLDKNFLRRIDLGNGELRLGMLETIREFALDHLTACGEEERARGRHAAYFLALAEQMEPAFYGPEQAAALALLTRELANLRAALSWLLEANELVPALRLAVALGRFWHVGGQLGERQRWLQRILGHHMPTPASLRAKALRFLGDGAWDTGDSAEAQRFYAQSLTFAEESGDPERIAEAMLGLGSVAAELQGDLATAEERFTRGLALHVESGNQWGAALMRLNLAEIALARGDLGSARALIEAALTVWRDLGYRQGVGRALYMLAQLEEERRQTTEALPRYEESLAAWRAVNYRAGVAEAAASIGWIHLAQGDHVAAAGLFAESLAIWREMASRRGIAASLESCAAVAVARDRPETALGLASAAAALLETTGTRPSSLEQARLAPWLSDARRRLGRDAAEAVWAAGAARPLASVIAEAVEIVTTSLAAHRADALPAPGATYELTRREVEVLRLLARHLTDREIADALSISPRTIMHHVSHILAKLGLASRRDAAAWAIRHGVA